jgi:hypothetical protein
VRVEDLTPAERKLQAAFLRGEDLDLRTRVPARDDPKHGAKWGSARTIRATVIAWLLTTPGAPDTMHAALRLTGARVVGELDLDYAHITCPVRLSDCHIAGPIRLYDAQTRHFSLVGCHIGHYYAANLTVNGTFRMSGCTVTGVLRLSNVHVSAMANLSGTRVTAALDPRPGISNPPTADTAVEADHLRVDGHVWMSGFQANGAVVLRAARINGDLDMRDARLSNPDSLALVTSRMRLDGRLDLEQAEVVGGVRIYDSVISGEAALKGIRISAPAGTALNASHCRIGAGLDLHGAVTDGAVKLLHADLNRTTFTDARVAAVQLQHARATELILNTACPPDGTVDLRHARIGVLRWENPSAWPEGLRLDGLTYDRLQSPQPAARQVAWLLRDTDGYVPQPFEQLAAMYRAIGHEGDAVGDLG